MIKKKIRRKKKKRKIRPIARLIILLGIIWLFSWWHSPPRGNKSVGAFVTEIKGLLERNSGYALYKTSEDFISTYPDSPKLYIAYFSLGVFYANKQQTVEAISNFTRTLQFKEIEPQVLFQAYALRAIQYIKIKRYDNALSDVKVAIKLTKNIDELAFLYYQKGFLENRLGEYDTAISSLNRAKFFNPDNGLLASILLEEAYAQRNKKNFRIARLLYHEIIDKFSGIKDAVKIAKDSLETVKKVERLQNLNKTQKKEMEKELKKSLDFYPF